MQNPDYISSGFCCGLMIRLPENVLDSCRIILKLDFTKLLEIEALTCCGFAMQDITAVSRYSDANRGFFPFQTFRLIWQLLDEKLCTIDLFINT